MDVEEAKAAILKRLCYDYKRWGREFSLSATHIQEELKVPGGVFGDRDGADLMRFVFSRNNPVLAFNALADETDRSEQEGLMHLFEGGVMLALRNPRAHALLDDSPEMALEYIAFISMLAKRLDQAKPVSS